MFYNFLLLVILISNGIDGYRKRDSDDELYEIRIFENAPSGTKATPNEAFDRALRERKTCFAQMDSDVEWIEFDPGLSMFITTQDVPATARSMQHASLHLMCASNQMRSINFAIHVTRRNRHPPKFSQESYHFYVPVSLQPGSEVGRVHVIDHDPIIYNSQVRLNIVEKETYWSADTKNGSILVRSPMTTLELFKPYNVQLVAIDFGSPQLFSLVNVTIVPVSITRPFNVRVNVANTGYQIFEWDSPEYGIADKFRLTIQRNRVVVHTQEVDGQDNMAMTKQNFHPGTDYSIVVTAIDIEGETPSEPHKFSVIGTNFECEGQCSEGGVPMCFYGKFHKIEQFRDKTGLHCLCYDGFSSPQCDTLEACPRERVFENFGVLDWPETSVNKSIALPCPYNFDGRHLARKCLWDSENEFARWENVSHSDVCRKQSTVLVHLGMLANFVEREAQRVSGFSAAQQFLDNLLVVPAFSPNVSTSHFDAKIAEHTAQLLDTLFSRNMSEISGNTTMVKQQLVDYVHRFSQRLPVPYTLESPKGGLQIKTFQWELQAENFPMVVGRRCYLHLPKNTYDTDNVRVICIKNTTVFPVLNGMNPVMSVEMDLKARIPPGGKVLIAIRPFNHTINHTCAFYDSKGIY
uniref:Fibronectin type-III domain-containing protein n=1 Tax=Acrobeloides nanus TaxID=290746 RepID=A0A914EME7_9BILA